MRPLTLVVCCSLLSFIAAPSAAQSIDAASVSASAMRLDGRLNEDVWRSAPAAKAWPKSSRALKRATW